MTPQDLLKLKNEVDTAKQIIAEKKGHQTALLNQLKTDWGCKTIEEAEKKLKSMNKDIDEMEVKIEETISEIEQKYNTED